MTNPNPLRDFPQWPVVVDLETRFQKTCGDWFPAAFFVALTWAIAGVTMITAVRHPMLLPFAMLLLAFAPLKTLAFMHVASCAAEPAPVMLLQGMNHDIGAYSSDPDVTCFADFTGSDAEVIASLEALVIKGQTGTAAPKAFSLPQLPAPREQ
jgi:hypothetical protein